MSAQYDLVIIGGGPGGYNCAIRAGQLGLKTAIVESRGKLGGTCLNVGCIPSKAMLHASELYEEARKTFPSLGIGIDGLKLDLPKMLAQKDEAVDGLTKGVEFLMKKNKVDYIKGIGKIAAPGKVEIKGEGGAKTLDTINIVIATGSEVTPLPGVDIDEERIVSSTGALELKKVPGKLVVIGGGVIGLELGSVWRRLGAEVTVVEFLDRILPTMDSEVSSQSLKLFKKQGMAFELSHKVVGVEKTKSSLSVAIEPKDGGKARMLDADIVLVSIGRRPFTQGLGLEKAGVKTDQRGFVLTDAHWKTNIDGIYAIGDVTLGPMLAHKAEEEGGAVAQILAGKWGHVNLDACPNVVYTKPEIASVGKTEEELKAAGVKYKSGKFPFIANSRARTNHETEGFVKILEDEATHRIVGAHMVGVGVGELVNEIAFAIEMSASAEDVARSFHAHPTLAEALREAAKGVDGWTMQA
jgi:dihydrolipoamide dehydrogenase